MSKRCPLKCMRDFVKREAKKVTKLPVTVKYSKKLPGNVVARHYRYSFYPEDKRIKPHVVKHEIVMRPEYNRQNDAYEVKQALLHELAHIKVNKGGHGPEFKKVAKRLGADECHQRGIWDCRDLRREDPRDRRGVRR